MQNTYPIVKIGTTKEEINLRVDNTIAITGEKCTGKSWLAIDLLRQLNNIKEVVIVSWQKKQIYRYKKSAEEIDLLDYFTGLLDLIENSSLDNEFEQTVFYIDGFSPNGAEKKLFKELFTKAKFSSFSFILTSRESLDCFNDLIGINIKTNKDNYEILNLSIRDLFDEYSTKQIRKRPYNLEQHYKIKEDFFAVGEEL